VATQRYISTSFWDDEWVQTLDPSEKLFYIYLLTNPLTNIAGVYKITDRRVGFDTGFSDEVISEMWMRFTRLNKAVRFGEWVIIPSWPRHQRWQDRKTIKMGIEKILTEVPSDVHKKLHEVKYSYPMDKVPDLIGTSSEDPSYLDSDSDLDRDTDLDSESLSSRERTRKEQEPDQEAPAEDNPFDDDEDRPFDPPIIRPNGKDIDDPKLSKFVQTAFESKTGLFTDLRKERDGIRELVRKATIRAPDNSEELVARVIAHFWQEKQSGRAFMRKQPFTPARCAALFDDLYEAVAGTGSEQSQLERIARGEA